MATGRASIRRPNYRFLPEDLAVPSDLDSSFELDESEIYYSFRSSSPDCKSLAGARIARKPAGKRDRATVLAPSPLQVNIPDSSFELDESETYCSFRSNSSDFRKSLAGARITRNPAVKRDRAAVLAPSSLPVNIPDWSKILRQEYQDSAWKRDSLDNDFDEDEGGGSDAAVLPPHEFLARQMAQAAIGSLEGFSRTMKVRELNRVRNAVWARIGFED